VFGKDAFRTGTGVHAAAVIKAMNKGDADLADRVYSGVPASWFGLRQEIVVGHMAGDSNIIYWLTLRGFEATDDRVAQIRKAAKSTNRLLTEDEILQIVHHA
ncbi:MAG: isopropylmalate/homocitrate/citramalate synthase, partial [Myxococcota bacterium]